MKILLLKARVERKITLEKLAESSGISKSTLQRIESKAVSPTMDTMEKLTKAMNMRITDLFESEFK